MLTQLAFVVVVVRKIGSGIGEMGKWIRKDDQRRGEE